MRRIFKTAVLLMAALMFAGPCFGAFSATNNVSLMAASPASDSNGGLFNTGATFATDGSATLTGGTWYFSSSAYHFVSGDVGYYLFLKAGTNSNPAFYLITGISGNLAALQTTAGTATLYPSYTLNTVGSLATGAQTSLSSLTWGVDYSCSTSLAAGGAGAYRLALTGLSYLTNTTSIPYTAASSNENLQGNGVQVTGGTAWTTGVYQITSVQNTYLTVDRACDTSSGTGGTANIGGAFLTPGAAITNMVGQNTLFVRAGTYLVATAPPTLPQGSSSAPTTIVGYNSTRGDLTSSSLSRPIVRSSAAMTALFNEAYPYWGIKNLTIDANAQTTTGCIYSVGACGIVDNCQLLGFTTYGFDGNSYAQIVERTEVSSPGNTVATAGITSTGTSIVLLSDYIHDVANIGVYQTTGGLIARNCIIANCSGAASDGINANITSTLSITNCDMFGLGRDAVHETGQGPAYEVIQNNIFANNGGVGISFSPSILPYWVNYDYNAYYNNTGGETLNFVLASGYTPPLSQSLTASPWVNVSTSGGLMNNSNFALNNTAGAGLACQNTGSPSAFPGTGVSQSNTYIGAIGPTPSAGIIGRGRVMN